MTTQNIILASSSPYRRVLLERLGLPFRCEMPDINEMPIDGESAEQLVRRLAETKARKVAEQHHSVIVIGSDQVALLDKEILAKPVTHEKAKTQLERLSDQCVCFITGLCVINTGTQSVQIDCISFHIKFRKLEADEIERYLNKERPYDCAGSFKSEGLGVSLLERMTGDDPTALIGLPLIRLSEMLRNEGITLP
ncbi:MAG: septum formation inhibitor Maf [Gammaproteobacteria bacterium]|nr:septum formation inhibitor Maf [Gammaproteobacteria bacterium]